MRVLRNATRGGHGLGPRRHWYQRFGIEPPFPWGLVGLYLIPVLIVLGGVVVGALLM